MTEKKMMIYIQTEQQNANNNQTGLYSEEESG
jgi:hypothetical protein